MTIKIVFDSNSVHQSKLGGITGVVYFDFCQDQQFPVAGWNDFVVVVAGWWLAALDEIASGKTETTLRFMDGPYWVTISRERNELLNIKCIEDRRGAGEIFEASVTMADLKAEVVKFAANVVHACSGRQIRSPDLDDVIRRLRV